MADVGGVITSQADLVWSLALGLFAFELLIVRNWHHQTSGGRRFASVVALVGAIAALIASMFLGYFTYGAVVELVRLPLDAAEKIEAQIAFVGTLAFLQAASFGIGLVLTLLLFFLNRKSVTGALAVE